MRCAGPAPHMHRDCKCKKKKRKGVRCVAWSCINRFRFSGSPMDPNLYYKSLGNKGFTAYAQTGPPWPLHSKLAVIPQLETYLEHCTITNIFLWLFYDNDGFCVCLVSGGSLYHNPRSTWYQCVNCTASTQFNYLVFTSLFKFSETLINFLK